MKIGEVNRLEILRFTSVGAYLGDEAGNDVLFPNKYLTSDLEVGDMVDVFIYNDSEDRPVATNEKPLIELNSFAVLNVKAISDFGAFLDWGLEKDLLVPFKEQKVKMREGGSYLVYMYLDKETNRLVATAKVQNFISKEPEEIEEGQEVDLLMLEKTDLGQKVIVENRYSGLVFYDYLSKVLPQGSRTKGYVKTIREDGKLDIVLEKLSPEKYDDHSQAVMEYLENNNGRMFLTDKSDPDEIRLMLGMSKKSFKRALGNLYKLRKIKIDEECIELI